MDPRIIGTEVYVLPTRTYTKIEMKFENGESNLRLCVMPMRAYIDVLNNWTILKI